MSEQAQTADQGNTAQSAQGEGQAQASLLTGEAQANPKGTEAKQPDAASSTQGDTNATTNDGEIKGDEKALPDDKTTDDKAEGAPEKYEFQAPEGFELDSVLVEQFEPLARELNLSNEKANNLVTKMMPIISQRFVEQQNDVWAKQQETWIGEVKADKDIGGEKHAEALLLANKALTKFAPELIPILQMPSKENPKGLGLGNHPELVRAFYRIGKASAEDGFVNSNTNSSGDQKSAAEILFGSNS